MRRFRFFGVRGSISLALICFVLLSNLLNVTVHQAGASSDGYVPIKWAVIVMGGYNYYRDMSFNAIQRVEKFIQGRGVPYDLMQDDDIIGPSDTPPAGKFALQHSNDELKYQVIILLFDYERYDSTGIGQNYIRWAVGNGTSIVLFNKVAIAVPELLGLDSSDVEWLSQSAPTSNVVHRSFDDGTTEYIEGSTISLGVNLYYHTIIRKTGGMTVWFNKTWTNNWSLGMANTTYGNGKVWYVGYSLNEYAMDYSALRYETSWNEWGMSFWGHSINFAFNEAQRIDVAIMPYKRWKGAWVTRVDADTIYWKEGFLPPEAALKSGWVYDYQYCALGYGRAAGLSDLSLTAGSPPGYSGIPSSEVMYTSVTGVLQANYWGVKTYRVIIYSGAANGLYDRIRIDFNENMDFADDTEYGMWENMTHPEIRGKLYWCKITPSFSNPTRINIAWWQTPMLMGSEETSLPLWKQYGAEYGLTYSLHGWQHTSLNPGSSAYPMWNGSQFMLDASYIEEKLRASRFWMAEKFEGNGHGFEEDQVVISHPFNNHPQEVDQVIDNLSWVLFHYDGAVNYVGFGRKSATSKYTLASANEETFDSYTRFATLEDMVRTLYPVISTFSHGIRYNTAFSFTPYSNSIKPANSRDAYHFWLNSKNMLESTCTAFYRSDRVTLEFDASTELTEYVWRFPTYYNGKEFSGFLDNRSIGEVKHTDEKYVYIEFSQGQGAQRLEITYGTPVPTIDVTVSEVYPENGGVTIPAAGVHAVAENTIFSITATELPGYLFSHWELNGINVGSANPYSFNVTSSDHIVGAFFSAIPVVTVSVLEVSPVGGGITDPVVGAYDVVENGDFSITATPLPGFLFDHWELDGVDVSTQLSYTFNVASSDHIVGAFFSAIPVVTVSVLEVSPVGGGITDPVAGAYDVVENGDFSITATPLPGYVFSHWELDGVPDGFELSHTFNVGTSNHTIRASFTELVSSQIDSCDSLQYWRPTGSLLSTNEIDFQEGSGAIEIATTATPLWHIYAILQKPMDFSEYPTLQIWVKVSDATKPLRLMIATNWGNYNVYTITGLTSNVWTLVSIDLSTPASTTGTMDFSSVSFLRFDYEVQRNSAYVIVDDIRGVYG